MKYTREIRTLSNGLRVVFDKRPSTESVGITCIVGAGSRHDYPGKDGLAHCVEHLVFRSGLDESEASLFQAIENVGGSIQAFTRIDNTIFTLCCLSKDIDLGLKVIGRVITHLPSDRKSLESEKAIVSTELSMLGQDNLLAFQRIKFMLLGGDKRLRHAVGGKIARIQKITQEDAARFHREFYTVSNMVLSFVGNIDIEDVVRKLENLFGDVSECNPRYPLRGLSATGPKVFSLSSHAAAKYITCFFRCPSLHSSRLAVLELLNDIFASSPHSRLFRKLREENSLVYHANSELALLSDFGTLDIYTATRVKDVTRVLDAIIDEIEDMVGGKIPNSEFNTAKERMTKRAILEFHDVIKASIWYAERELLSSRDNADDMESWCREIIDVSMEDLVRMARELFAPENIFIYVIGSLGIFRARSIRQRLSVTGKDV